MTGFERWLLKTGAPLGWAARMWPLLPRWVRDAWDEGRGWRGE